MVACAHNRIDVVEFLAKRFPRCTDWKNKVGFTPLMTAAKMGNDGVVCVLLDVAGQWVDVDACDGSGNTGLHVSCTLREGRFKGWMGGC